MTKNIITCVDNLIQEVSFKDLKHIRGAKKLRELWDEMKKKGSMKKVMEPEKLKSQKGNYDVV